MLQIARVENLPIAGPDHGLILLVIGWWNLTRKLSPFKFEIKWLLYEKFWTWFTKFRKDKLKTYYINEFNIMNFSYQLARKNEFLKKKKNSENILLYNSISQC